MIDVGVGEVPASPDEWHCPTHGRWYFPVYDGPPFFEYPNGANGGAG